MSCSTQTARFLAAAAAAVLCGVLAMACQVSQQTTKAKGGDDTAQPMNTADEAEQAFDAAEKELGDMLLVGGTPAPLPTLSQPAPDPGMAEGGATPKRPENSTSTYRVTAANRCERACRALASMKRAADRLCELTGESDSRCQSVRARVDAARTIVQSACPDCSE